MLFQQEKKINSKKKTYLFFFSLSLLLLLFSFFRRDVGSEDDNSDDGDVLIVVAVVVLEADCSSHESCFGENHNNVLAEIDGGAKDKIARDFVLVFRVAFAAPAKPRRRSRFFHGFLVFAGIDGQRGSAR